MSDFIEFFGKLNTHQLRSLIREFNHQDVLKSYFKFNKADLLNAMSQVYSYKNGVISINKTLPKNLLGFLNKSGVKKVRYSQEPINVTAGKTEVPKNTDLQTVNLGVNYSKKEAKLASQSIVNETPAVGHRTNKELMNKIANLEKELADTKSAMIEKKETAPSTAPVFKEAKKVRTRNDVTNMGVKPVEKIPEPVKQVETTPVDDALTIKAKDEVAGKEPDTKPIEELNNVGGKKKKIKIEKRRREKPNIAKPISPLKDFKDALDKINEGLKQGIITEQEGAMRKKDIKDKMKELIGVPKEKLLALPAPQDKPKPIIKEKKKVFSLDSDDESEVLTPEQYRQQQQMEREARIKVGTKKFAKVKSKEELMMDKMSPAELVAYLRSGASSSSSKISNQSYDPSKWK
jgi:hypothetical protein